MAEALDRANPVQEKLRHATTVTKVRDDPDPWNDVFGPIRTTLGCIGAIALFFLVAAILGGVIRLISGGGDSQAEARSPYYEKQLRDGIKAYDPSIELSAEDERLIRSMAREMNK